MSFALDGIVLNPDMVWRERLISKNVLQTTRLTLGGAPFVSSGSIDRGIPITLSATEVNGILIGVLKKSVVDLLLIRAAIPGASYLFTVDGATYTVIFRHEEWPAIDMTPIIAKQVYVDSDLMRGDIKLMTI